MAEPVNNILITEQRKELMISPTETDGFSITYRKGHFLKPTVTAIDGPPLKLPSLNPKPMSPQLVTFNHLGSPSRKWKTWIRKMHSRYESVWKDAGIYEALMCSKHKITSSDGVLFAVAERWCSDTNTFIFPWGEATITLEDILILGGFSVTGSSVLLPLEPELVSIQHFLEESFRSLGQQETEIHSQWLDLFRDKGSPREHEAFLSYWLSRFVFPGEENGLTLRHVFPVAIHLARGRRLALGPAILASIYRELGLLRMAMKSDRTLLLILSSPLCLVQVWAWERLPPLQPKVSDANIVDAHQVRIGQWSGRKNNNIRNWRQTIDSAGMTFVWRPYARAVDNWSFPRFYKEKETWVSVQRLSEELESFVRCFRPCHLAGIDCVEPYNPHRVAMQFGLDQDLPGCVLGDITSRKIAWNNYSKPLNNNEVLYFPSRISEPHVTTRYLEWWRHTVLCPVNAIKGLVKGRRSRRKPCKNPLKLVIPQIHKKQKRKPPPLLTLPTGEELCRNGTLQISSQPSATAESLALAIVEFSAGNQSEAPVQG